MELRMIASVLARRRRNRRHEQWTAAELARHQAESLAALRAHAVARSRFYQRLHVGYERAPLAELPVVTKAMLMESFDDLVVDPAIHLADVLRFLETDDGRTRYLDRYWVAATSGSSGRRGVFLFDRSEWTTMIASYARAQEWAGVAASPIHRVRMAVVSSRTSYHASSRVGETVDSAFIPTLRLESSDPLRDNVARLDEFQPDCLVGYASMLHVLAAEQLEGRLHIRPRGVISASEVLTPETIRRVEHAWGAAPFDTYVATETAGIASDCRLHRKHLYEDLVIVESVDEHHRPVPTGTTGASMLVTALFSRTQPLIRYEMSDCLALSTERCACGIGFALLDRIEGRREDIIELPGRDGGSVSIHPNVFHRVLELVPAAAWQVVVAPDAVRVLLERPHEVDRDALERAVAQSLSSQGAAEIPVRVEVVDTIPRAASGKAPLVRRAEPARIPQDRHL
jgi:putative adenylate-forming enzyme